MNVSSSSLLNESSSFYKSPVLNEIFELKSCINNKRRAIYNFSISIFSSLQTIFVLSTSELLFQKLQLNIMIVQSILMKKKVWIKVCLNQQPEWNKRHSPNNTITSDETLTNSSINLKSYYFATSL